MNIDFKSIVIYLHHKGYKIKSIKDEIDSVFGENSYSCSAISKSIRSLSFSPVKDDHINEEEKYVHDQRIEVIKKTLEDNPFYSIKQIAEETKIPKTSVYRIVTGDLGYVMKHLKWIPYDLNSSQKVSHVNLSKSLLQILQKDKKKQLSFYYNRG